MELLFVFLAPTLTFGTPFVIQVDLTNDQVVAWASLNTYRFILALSKHKWHNLRPVKFLLKLGRALGNVVRQLAFFIVSPNVELVDI